MTSLRTTALWCMAVGVILFTGHRYMLPYAAAMGAALWVLHRSQRYRQPPGATCST